MGSFIGLDAEHQRELDYLETQIEVDNEIYHASMQFETMELIDKAELHGEVYAATYEKGFWDAVDLYRTYHIEATEERDKICNDKITQLRIEAEERQASLKGDRLAQQ